MKVLSFDIPEGLPRQKLLHYVQRSYPEIPAYRIRGAFDRRDVKLNGVRCGKDAMLTSGSVLLYLPEEKEKEIPILYRSDELLIVRKPAGIACEAASPGERTIADMIRRQTGEKAFLCHRLDAPTEGLLILALQREAQEKMTEAFREGLIQKEYLCLVRGVPPAEHAVLRAWLLKDALHGEVRISSGFREGAKEVVTEYWVLQKGEVSRLRVRLHTGRTHQIRAHLAWSGFPLLGDDRYGDRQFNKQYKTDRLRLCSASLRFDTHGLFPELDGKCFETEPSF